MFSRIPIATHNRGRVPVGPATASAPPFLGMSTVGTDASTRRGNGVSYRQGALWSTATHQYVCYWLPYLTAGPPQSTEDVPVIARRRHGTDSWEKQICNAYGSGDTDDEHNHCIVAVDGSGYVWLIGGTHVTPMRAARGATPGDMNVQPVSIPLVAGSTLEAEVTYQQLIGLPNGDFLMTFRDGESGDGNTILIRLNHAAQTWSTVHGPLIDGEAAFVSFYIYEMYLDDNNGLHLAFNCRDSSDAGTAHDVFYAFSPDYGTTWYQDPLATVPQTVPITLANANRVVQRDAGTGSVDLGCVFADDTGRPFICTFWDHSTVGTPHTATDSPHDTDYFIIAWNGSGWDTHQMGELGNTIYHYPNFGGGGPIMWPRGVWHNNQVFVYVTGSPNYAGVYCLNASDSNLNLWNSRVVNATNYGQLDAIIDDQRWRRHRVISLYQQTILMASPPSATDIGVWEETLDGIPAPSADMLHLSVSGTVAWSHRVEVNGSPHITLVEDTPGVFTCSQLNDRVASGTRHLAQAGAAAVRPNYDATGDLPCIKGDAAGKFMLYSSWDPPQPGTQPWTMFLVARLDTWGSARVLIGGNSAVTIGICYGLTASPQVLLRNGVLSANVNMTVGQRVLVEVHLSNSTSDFLRIGSIDSTTGVNLGNNNPTAAALFALTTGLASTCGGYSFWEGFCVLGLPSAPEFAAVRAAAQARYPGISVSAL